MTAGLSSRTRTLCTRRAGGFSRRAIATHASTPFHAVPLRAVFVTSGIRTLSSALPPHTVLQMPALSPTMEHGNIIKWLKSEGDEVTTGDILAEIETDKATLEWDSMDDGYLARIFVSAPANGVPVGAQLAVLCEAEEDVPAFKGMEADTPSSSKQSTAQSTSDAEGAGSTTPAIEVSGGEGGVPGGQLSPAVLALIRRHRNINFSHVKGTGPRGIVLKGDILAAVKQGPSTTPKPRAADKAPPASPTPAPSAPATSHAQPSTGSAMSDKTAVPHFYLSIDCSVSAALELSHAVGIGLDDVVIAAASRALTLVPEANATFHTDFVRVFSSPDVALFTPSAEGSLTSVSFVNPVKRTLSELSSERQQLQEQARTQQAPFAQGNRGTVVVAVDHHITQAPLHTVPHTRSLTLGVGAVKSVVRPGQGGRAITGARVEKVVSVSLGCDHRVIDGVLGARYLQAFQKVLEQPALLAA